MSPPTADSAQNSLLLNLPAELRDRTYENAIEDKPRIATVKTREISGVRSMRERTMRVIARITARACFKLRTNRNVEESQRLRKSGLAQAGM
jgi:hypothetical protein